MAERGRKTKVVDCPYTIPRRTSSLRLGKKKSPSSYVESSLPPKPRRKVGGFQEPSKAVQRLSRFDPGARPDSPTLGLAKLFSRIAVPRVLARPPPCVIYATVKNIAGLPKQRPALRKVSGNARLRDVSGPFTANFRRGSQCGQARDNSTSRHRKNLDEFSTVSQPSLDSPLTQLENNFKLVDLWLAQAVHEEAQRETDLLLELVGDATYRLLGPHASADPLQALDFSAVQAAVDFRISSSDGGLMNANFFGKAENARKTLPNIFRSVSVSDPRDRDNPVKLVSGKISAVPEQETLLFRSSSGDMLESCLLLVNHAAKGGLGYTLAFTNSLVSQDDGRIVHVLTSDIDITHYLRHGVIDDILGLNVNATGESPNGHEAGSDIYQGNRHSAYSIDWLEVANEEKLKTRQQGHSSSSCANSSQKAVPLLGENSELALLIRQIKVLYKDYFVLCPSDESGCFEISYISPATFQSGDHVDGHLRHTSPEVIHQIGECMARREDAVFKIRWGPLGDDKWMYCTQLLGSGPECWLCILTDTVSPCFW
ncbi:MAG: hypothetical protein M1819_000725 [Sarea resinae]|nr:MAG: hypothetical protein M1819_000725 [Sarea resinae]